MNFSQPKKKKKKKKKKKENFQIKNSDYFRISLQNMECGYSLEPSRQGGLNEYHNVCFSKKR